ncbi:MAG TPA: hypothetical protein VEZ14_00150 [Dehalococcoidia bacterium]|nr:hypothetical protein [Dehalococcoidia bacterium]
MPKSPRMTDPAPPEGLPDGIENGLRHRHQCEMVTALAGLQSAHHWLRWDVGRSRILSVGVCRVCGECDRTTVQACADTDCQAHPICQRPYR